MTLSRQITHPDPLQTHPSVFCQPITLRLIIIATLGANALDLVSTYAVSPDLRHEGNFVFRWLGGGVGDWYLLLLLKSSATLFGVALLSGTIRQIPELYPFYCGKSIAQFLSIVQFGKIFSPFAFLLKTPFFNFFKILSGYFTCLTLIVAGSMAAMSNLLQWVESLFGLVLFHLLAAIAALTTAFVGLWWDYNRCCHWPEEEFWIRKLNSAKSQDNRML